MIRHAVEPCTPPLGKCSKHDCEMLQRYDICSQHTSAELLFMEGRKMYTLYAYGDSVKNSLASTVTKLSLRKPCCTFQNFRKFTSMPTMLSQRLNTRVQVTEYQLTSAELNVKFTMPIDYHQHNFCSFTLFINYTRLLQSSPLPTPFFH